ncbi:MAG: hypothetical protein WAU88_10685 [Candidatus Zixiibacteriota bacterium]
MVKRTALVLYLLIFWLWCEAVGQTTGPSTDSSAIVPLKVGYTWKGTLSNFQGSDSSKTTNDIFIKQVEQIGGESWYRWGYVTNGDSSAASGMFANRSDGLWATYIHTSDTGLVLDHPMLWLKFPVALHAEYEGGIEETIKVLSIDTLVTTPAGTFHCICYLSIDPQDANSTGVLMYVSPGIGWVQKVALGRFQPDVLWKWQLTEFIR